MINKETAGGGSGHWPRLLIVGSFLPGFALERYVGGDLAMEIRKRGGLVLTTSHLRCKPFRLADMLITVFRRRHDYDVALVTVFSGPAFIYAECVATLLSKLRKPCTMGLHGGDLPDFARRHPGRVTRLLGSSVCVVCPSRYLFEKIKLFRQDMHLIPNALHIKDYTHRMNEAGGLRLLWLRAFHGIYKPEMAVAVLALVLKSFPGATLTMVGPDKGDGSLGATRRAAEQAGVLEKITFTGPVPKESVARVMGQHDIFINTTSIDNMPVSVIEAMACGLCVVSTNVGGLPYLLDDEQDSLLVPPGDPAAMAIAVSRILRDRALAERLSRNARIKVEGFDWSIILPQWKTLLVEAAAGRPR